MKLAWSFLLALSSWLTASGVERITVDFDYVQQRAAERWAATELRNRPPHRVAATSSEDARTIRFRPERALWGADHLPFQIWFEHPAGVAEPMILHEFSSTHAQTIPFVREFFETANRPGLDSFPPEAGYAGFDVASPLNRPERFDPLVVFGEASYFRAVGAGQAFGVWARGLALDCGLQAPEEFPRFTQCWLGKPAPDARTLTIYALLESPRAVGAFEFTVAPGPTTTIDVHCVVTFRAAVARPGFAPLNSLFWFGENSDRPAGQPRPEVHDSDGLVVELADGTCLWRPLQNPAVSFSSGQSVVNPRRFGLVQRDRVFEHYEDLDAGYERRPSAWVEPLDNWGAGTVQLVELPAHGETMDNIVAFWVPAETPAPGRPIELRYRLRWGENDPAAATTARAIATHVGALPGNPLGRLFWIDFSGADIATRAPDDLAADVTVEDGVRLLAHQVVKNPHNATWRASLQVEAEQAERPAVLRCRLRSGYAPVSETWTYAWRP